MPMNLQLFANDEEEDDVFLNDDLEDTEEIEVEEAEETEETEQLDDIETEEEFETLDKKTKSIIKHKKENKKLRRQLQELQGKMQAEELEKETNQRIIELTKGGKSTTEATKIANDEVEVKKLRLQLVKFEIEGLETKYPGISQYYNKLAQDKAKLPDFSYEQIYLAKYAKSNAYDEKTRVEQELMYKTKEARNKSLDNSNTKTSKPTKLTPEDERVYQYIKKTRPNLTRKQFLNLAESSSLEE